MSSIPRIPIRTTSIFSLFSRAIFTFYSLGNSMWGSVGDHGGRKWEAMQCGSPIEGAPTTEHGKGTKKARTFRRALGGDTDP